MAAWNLVSRDQVQGGEALILLLPGKGVEVTGAAWVKTDDDGQPYLYVVSPTVEDAGPLEAASRLVAALNELDQTPADPFQRIDPYGIRLVSPSDPVAGWVRKWHERRADDRPTFHSGGSVNGVPLDGAYLYPAAMFAPPAATAPSA